MDPKEASRLARQCLCEMMAISDNHGSSNNTRKNDKKNRNKNTNTEIQVQSKTLCRLWGGMGHVYEVSCGGGDCSPSFIVKRIDLRGASSPLSFGDERKAFSYQVEVNFYKHYAKRLIENFGIPLPRPYLVEQNDNDGKVITICMSKLEQPPGNVDAATIQWLAMFHAATWGDPAEGLQPIGSYWYLDTRPDEHQCMPRHGWQGRLKRAARALDDRLKRDPMQCIIHGDAKDANVLWPSSSLSSSSNPVSAMCDFQYCGKGPPTRDLAYFLCTSLTNPNDETRLVQLYYQELISHMSPLDIATKPSWEQLQESLELAYCDLARFMSGWGFWGFDLTSRVVAVLDRLDGGVDLGSEHLYDEAVRRLYG